MILVHHPNRRSTEKEVLCKRVLAELGPDYAPSYVVFDYAEYSDSPSCLDELRDIAFTWNPGDVILTEPYYLRELMAQTECAGIIWLSVRALDFPSQLFAWIVAHEARHIFQFRKNPSYSTNRIQVGALRRKPEFIGMSPLLFGLGELDSEISALRALRKLYGTEVSQEFMAQTELPRGPFPIYNQFLTEAESQWVE